jgi:DNA-directed RNA polymerase specialized sigma subunit
MTSPQASYVDAPLNLEQRDELVLSHLTEVLFIARRIHERLPGGVPLEDLVHSGVLGLLQATQNFDSTRNIKFKTFAKFRHIAGGVLVRSARIRLDSTKVLHRRCLFLRLSCCVPIRTW